MAGISDKELKAQLNSFMRTVPLLWTWDELQAMFKDGEQYTEVRGTDRNWIAFELLLLEDDVQSNRRYLNVSVSANDARSGLKKGNVYRPFGNNFIWYQDGELDMEEL